MTDPDKGAFPLPDGTVYSKRKNFCPFSTPPPEAYAPIIGEEKMEELQEIARRLKGLKLLELNSSASGGGVAEMLFSSAPFLNSVGIGCRDGRGRAVVKHSRHNISEHTLPDPDQSVG